MASGSYNITKSAVQSFFVTRLSATFGKNITVVPGRVVGNDENPRFTLLVDNSTLARMRKKGSEIPDGLPLPVCFLIGFHTDGKGGGRIELSFYKEHLRGNTAYDNTNVNLRKWGFPSPDDNKISVLTKHPIAISEFDTETASIVALNKVRNIANKIAGYRINQ